MHLSWVAKVWNDCPFFVNHLKIPSHCIERMLIKRYVSWWLDLDLYKRYEWYLKVDNIKRPPRITTTCIVLLSSLPKNLCTRRNYYRALSLSYLSLLIMPKKILNEKTNAKSITKPFDKIKQWNNINFKCESFLGCFGPSRLSRKPKLCQASPTRPVSHVVVLLIWLSIKALPTLP